MGPDAPTTDRRAVIVVAVFLLGSTGLQDYAHHLQRSLESGEEKPVSTLYLQPAPEFTLDTLPPAAASPADSQPVSLADHRGKIVFISFWASWCRPCDYELPVLNQFYQENRAHNVQVLAISTDADREAALAYAQKHNYSMPMLWDEGGRVADQYQVSSLPTLVVVGPEGRVRSVERGLRYDMQSWLRGQVKQLRPKPSARSSGKS